MCQPLGRIFLPKKPTTKEKKKKKIQRDPHRFQEIGKCSGIGLDTLDATRYPYTTGIHV